MSALAGAVPLAVRAPLAGGLPLADSDHGKGSPIGLFVVLLLLVATYLLYRSMSGHLRRLPDRFPGYRPADGEASDGAVPDGAVPDGAAPDKQHAAEPAGAEPAGTEAVGAEPGRPATPDVAVQPGNQAGEGGERTGLS